MHQHIFSKMKTVPHLGEPNPTRNGGKVRATRTAWAHLPALTELALELGADREELLRPKGVFLDLENVAHLRSECTKRHGITVYRKVQVEEHERCAECGGYNTLGRSGFGQQPLLVHLAIMTMVHQCITAYDPARLAAQGSRLRVLHLEAENLDDTLAESAASTENLPEKFEEVTGEILEMVHDHRQRIEETLKSEKYREVLEEELTTALAKWLEQTNGNRREKLTAETVLGAYTGPQLLVARSSIGEDLGWVLANTYPRHRLVREGWSEAHLVEVPGSMAALLGVLHSDLVEDGPVPAPEDPQILETAVKLYEPEGHNQLSRLEGAVQAAQLV